MAYKISVSVVLVLLTLSHPSLAGSDGQWEHHGGSLWVKIHNNVVVAQQVEGHQNLDREQSKGPGWRRIDSGWLWYRDQMESDIQEVEASKAGSFADVCQGVAMLLFLVLGVGLAVWITSTHYENLLKAARSEASSSNRELKKERTRAEKLAVALQQYDVPKPGERLVTAVRVNAENVQLELIVSHDYHIQLPRVGRVDMTGIPLCLYAPYVNHIVQEFTRIRNDYQRQEEERVTQALTLARTTFEQQLRGLQNEIPKPDQWNKLHQQYRAAHIRASRHGRILTVVAHGDPSGAMQIDWKVLNPPPVPYQVTVKEDNEAISTEWSHAGRVNRFLKPGYDYRYSFEVIEPGRAKAPNLEPDFSFIVSVPTRKQWYWKERHEAPETQSDPLEEIKQEVVSRQKAEQEIDALGLSEEEAAWAKSRYAAKVLGPQNPQQ
jgi:hypothetical protein